MWILVVENEAPMGELLRQGLEEENHAVTLARDGMEGLHAAKTSSFDAIVLDVMMPGMDGFEVARRLRAAGQQVPIIMLTARDSAADIVKGLGCGPSPGARHSHPCRPCTLMIWCLILPRVK